MEATLDKKWISNEKQKMKEDIEPVGHNFEAVGTFKEYCDKKDQCYVYRINNRRGNLDKPSFVFKTSEQKANVAFNMDPTDVRDSTILNVKLKTYADGAATGGNRPSYVQRRRKQFVREINHAKQLGREMFKSNTVDDGLVVDPSSSHRPLERRKKSSKTDK